MLSVNTQMRMSVVRRPKCFACVCVYVSVFTTLYKMYGSPFLKNLELSNAMKLLLIPLQLAGLTTLCYCFSKANYNNKVPILI